MKFLNYESEIQAGNITKRKHPKWDLWILNYTPKCSYDSAWNDITRLCRGLIIDSKDNIICRPFEKFYNWEEIETKWPDIFNKYKDKKPLRVSEKVDGSLGIATRGSFESEQAIRGSEILNKKYLDELWKLRPYMGIYTFLFEIIYPENKIVVQYDEEKLVLLDVIENSTGNSKLDNFSNLNFKTATQYHWSSYDNLKSKNIKNKEGYVLIYDDNYRIKIKFENYIKLHYLKSNVSNYSIWEMLKNNESVDDLIKELPDEMYDWVKNIVEYFESMEFTTNALIINIWNESKHLLNISRKNFALYINSVVEPRLRSALYAMADKKDIHPYIWNILKPEQKTYFNKIQE